MLKKGKKKNTCEDTVSTLVTLFLLKSLHDVILIQILALFKEVSN